MNTKKREFIDPNELMRYINEKHCYSGLPMAAHICTMELLTYAPRVDVAEVVRCKDCKHTRKKSAQEQFMYNENVCICTKEDIWGITKNELVWDDWFCSCGERKDND